MTGPLAGIRIIELATIGAVPFCGMMLADHGAEVIRIERVDSREQADDALLRSRSSIPLNLKKAACIDLVRDLVKKSDGFIEGFRPGVAERLGLGPSVLCKDNAKLVYGRLTGWGQSGPLSQDAGHDLNYIGLSGALHTIGAKETGPVIPANYLGDYAGGGMMMAYAMVSALLSARVRGVGDVIDCSMSDGAALLTSLVRRQYDRGLWKDEPGVNEADGGAPYYNIYECSDGKFIAVAAVESKFYHAFLKRIGLESDPAFSDQKNPASWPNARRRVSEKLKARTRDDWCAYFADEDACVTPVLSLSEAPFHPHNARRNTFCKVGSSVQASPSPLYSRHELKSPDPHHISSNNTVSLLRKLGFSESQISGLERESVIE